MNFEKIIAKCNSHEIENHFEHYTKVYKDNKNIFKTLILKAFELGKYEFICVKLSEWLLKQKEITKENNEIFETLIYCNIKTNNHLENYSIYKNHLFKIRWNNEFKDKILSRLEYSLTELEKYNESLEIFEETKKYSDKNYRNYINCLVKMKDFRKAIINLKKYHPKTDESKIWKAITVADIYYLSEDIQNLKKYLKQAEKTYLKYRVTEEILTHSGYYYYLGIFNLKLMNTVTAINYFKLSKTNDSNLVIDIKYKNMAIEQLNSLEVKK